ncbi:ATP-grasp domain-containing protein [Paraburkholderia fungorum]|uniref:ATP-grasp domain-containing protein n=1 Tax=Paraburkholderia fungorum TaxID=134537 RepID=UPI0038B7E029
MSTLTLSESGAPVSPAVSPTAQAVTGVEALLIVGTLRTGTSLALVDAALKRGLTVTIITAPDDVARDIFPSEVRIVPLEPDAPTVLAWIETHCTLDGLRITTTNERYARLAAHLATTLDLAGPDEALVSRYIEKSNQKQLFSDAGVDTPPAQRWRVGTFKEHVRLSGTDLQFPLVIKPVEGLSSYGVALCSNLAELEQTLVAQSSGTSDAQAILVEQYIAGPEYCVEFFDGQYVGAMLKRKAKGNQFIERGYSSDLDLDDSVLATLISACKRAVQASGLIWGPVHIDCIVSGGKPHLVEVNARIAGSFICTIVRDAYGFDIVGALLDKLDGKPVQVPDTFRPHRYACVEFFLDDDPPLWNFTQGGRVHSDWLTISYGPQVIPARERRAFLYTTNHPPSRHS